MAFVVARMELQSSKTVNGTPSRSQYVMRSEERQEEYHHQWGSAGLP